MSYPSLSASFLEYLSQCISYVLYCACRLLNFTRHAIEIKMMLPRWLSGKGSTCQYRDCRRHELIPGWKDPLEEEIVTHSSILARKIPEQSSLEGYSP